MHSDFIQMRSIVKVFQPATVALDGVSVDINQGEIHSVIGKNGAGKSTLMKVLYGMVARTAARSILRAKVNFSSRDAVKAGIGMIHQEFMLIPSYTIWENVVLGAEPANRWAAWKARAGPRCRRWWMNMTWGRASMSGLRTFRGRAESGDPQALIPGH